MMGCHFHRKKGQAGKGTEGITEEKEKREDGKKGRERRRERDRDGSCLS